MLKITADRLTFKDAAALVKRAAVGRYAPLPALAGILIDADADAGTLTLSATDLERTARVSMFADVSSSGRTLIDARQLVDTVKNGGDAVTIVADGQRVTFDAGAAVTVRPLGVGDFPPLPAIDGRTVVSVHPSQLEVLRRVVHAASTDEARPVLTGVYVDEAGNLAATDSYRLAWTDEPIAPGLAGQLIPAHAVREVLRWKTDGQTVGVGADGERVTFYGRHVAGPKRARRELGIVYTARTIAGAFPNYRALLPSELEVAYRLEAADTADALRQLERAAGGPNVPVLIDYSAGRLTLELDGGDRRADTTVSVLGLDGETFPAAYNPAFLADALEAAAGDDGTVVLEARDALKPAVCRGGAVSVLIMPMRSGAVTVATHRRTLEQAREAGATVTVSTGWGSRDVTGTVAELEEQTAHLIRPDGTPVAVTLRHVFRVETVAPSQVAAAG